MTTSRLRDTFALLLRGAHDTPAVLSGDAERTIRRRVGLRWTGRIGALAAVGALGTAAIVGAYGGGNGGNIALPSPTPTPTLGVSSATFPLTGGPEFERASSGLKCGDPAPAPQESDHGVTLGVATDDTALSAGSANTLNMPTVMTPLAYTTTDDLGAVANSGTDLLVVRDGVIVGFMYAGGVELGGPASGSGLANTLAPAFADWTHCPGDLESEHHGVDPGTYQLIAIARVFSTPESVALSQALSSGSYLQLLDTMTEADPYGVYLPGSYDCRLLRGYGQTVRGCLPDLTSDAIVDPSAGTVTVFYEKKRLVEEFSTVLVSESLTVSLVDSSDVWPDQGQLLASGDMFDSLESLVCGATASGVAVGAAAAYHVESMYESAALGEQQEGAAFPGTIFVGDAPDGSTIELLPGATLVWFKDSSELSVDGQAITSTSTVIAWAPLIAAQDVTTARYVGPQATVFTTGPTNLCPGEPPEVAQSSHHSALAGQWRVTTPDGAVTTVESATDPITSTYQLTLQ